MGRLQRSTEAGADWIGADGVTYNGMLSDVDSTRFDSQFEAIKHAVVRHLDIQGLDKIVIDLSRLTPAQVDRLRSFVSTLAAPQQAKIWLFGGQ